MPFDENTPDDHGGGGRGDDPEKIRQIISAALAQMQANIEINGVCPLHTRLDVIMAMAMEIIDNIRWARNDPTVENNFEEMATKGLIDVTKHIREELER